MDSRGVVLASLLLASPAFAGPRQCAATETFPTNAPADLDVVVACTVGPDRGLTKCAVVAETPKASGFAEPLIAFAKAAAKDFIGDAKVGSRVEVCGVSSIEHPLNIAPARPTE